MTTYILFGLLVLIFSVLTAGVGMFIRGVQYLIWKLKDKFDKN